MAAHVEHVRGRERLDAVTAVLQRARLADPTGGVWEAADVQWWWRRPRASDGVRLPVWYDDNGPAAAAVLTAWDDVWQADAVVVPGTVDLEAVWSAVVNAAAAVDPPTLEVLAREDDDELLALLGAGGFGATSARSGITWMDTERRPSVGAVPDGYRIVDRASRGDRPHPMRARNGDEVEARLRECSLYEPELDLAVETRAGEPAGYALFWLDPVTHVGMLEPMRIEDLHQRRGLARALLTTGLDRLATRGARRLKVGFSTDAAQALYVGAGFVVTHSLRAHRRPGRVAGLRGGASPGGVQLQRLRADDWALWREVRLRALTEAPYAFGATLEEWQGDGDHEHRWRSRLEAVPLNVVALVGGTAVGQVSGTTLDDRARCELISMWVDPAARGTGVGEALIGEVVAWASTQGAAHVVLSVKERNAHAIALYRRAGFVELDEPADDCCEIRLQRALDQRPPAG